jgi:hypothetical protein
LSDGVYEKIEVTNGREQSKTIVAHIKDVDNREQSQVFIGKDIYIDKEQLPKLNPGEHYWYEMIGFEVINQHNEKLGEVDYFVDIAVANDVFLFLTPQSFLPAVSTGLMCFASAFADAVQFVALKLMFLLSNLVGQADLLIVFLVGSQTNGSVQSYTALSYWL